MTNYSFIFRSFEINCFSYNNWNGTCFETLIFIRRTYLILTFVSNISLQHNIFDSNIISVGKDYGKKEGFKLLSGIEWLKKKKNNVPPLRAVNWSRNILYMQTRQGSEYASPSVLQHVVMAYRAHKSSWMQFWNLFEDWHRWPWRTASVSS